MSKNVTSIEVAKRAGVSQSTVSRVFSKNSPNVSQKARDKVLQAAQELGYQPNIIARMMSTRQTNIIGIVMATVTSPFYPYVLEKFLRELQSIGKQVLLFTASAGQTVDDILPLVLQYQVDGLIVTSATLSSEMAASATQAGTPVILFNRSLKDDNISAVIADNVLGGQIAADTLVDTGHQHIAYIAGIQDTSTNQEREHGFIKHLQKRDCPLSYRIQGHYTYDSGYDATMQLLSENNPPDAIFCANDIMAIGAIDAIRQSGLLIPDDISVIGFDNIPMANWGAYKLTTISQEVDNMITKTIGLLLEKIDNPSAVSRTERIAGNLIVRASVKNLKGSG